MSVVRIFFLVLCVTGGVAISASKVDAQSYNHCVSVYETATRNLTIFESSFSSLNSVFDDYCSASGEIRSDATDVGIEAVIKRLPIKFTGHQGSSRQRMASFCRDYSATRYSAAASSSFQDQVVVEALRAFNQCIDISRRNIVVNFTSPIGISSVFGFEFGSNVSYELQGVIVDDGIQCSTRNPEDGTFLNLSADSYLTFTKNFSISCVRRPASRENGSKYYRRTSVTFASNHGPYSAVFPAEEIEDVEFASALTERMAALEARTHSLTTQLKQDLQIANTEIERNSTALANLLTNLKVKTYAVMRGGNKSLADPGFQAIGCLNLDEFVARQCPNMRVQTQLLKRFSGGPCGYRYALITCLALE